MSPRDIPASTRRSFPNAFKYCLPFGITLAVLIASCGTGEDSQSVDSTIAPEGSTTIVPYQGPPTCAEPGVLACLLPWPSNRLTVPDSTTMTGLRLSIPSDAVPMNVDGTAIDVTDQNRADGFSPNSFIVFDAPEVDLLGSGVPDSTDIGRSLEDSNPIQIIDTETNVRWPFWGERDLQSGLVTLRPATAFLEGHTYDVIIGTLVDGSGSPVTLPTSQWSFTIASEQSLAGRLLYERAIAYEQIGEGVPSFKVDSVTEGSVRTVEGTFDIPNFLSNDGSPGGHLLFDEAGNPMINEEFPKYSAAFRCVVPDQVTAPVPALLYGHGLLGDRGQVDFFGTFAGQGLITGCAVDWLGMASEDIVNLAEILADMSRFNEQADRMLQGLIAFQLLGRLTNSADGFVTDPAFQNADGSPIIAQDSTVFVGNSQGGILGGAASAISTEWKRAVLGVPGMNYSLLLPRSSDWPQFQVAYEAAYTKTEDRLMGLALVQLLWDRGENGGYAQHLSSNPYEGFEAKDLLLVGAFGDHQVANVSTEVLARTIGARVHSPALQDGRSSDVVPLWGIEPITYPYSGTALVMWDYGTPRPPIGPEPPNEPEFGLDPHGAGSDEALVLVQALGYLLSGGLQNVCGEGPCIGTQIDSQ
ncbi:MAG: hypothetical protein JHD36_06480 [Ilumatobacteraceae bacterium]|nr:hypothetical protein [Ilumatobacteraceae bacterium]